MKIIHSGDLTAAEWQAIAERYDGWHTVAEFWIGFNDCQHGRYKCPDDWADIARQVWDLGIEAAMRIRWERYRCEYARDDLDSRTMIRTLDAMIEERKKERDEAAAWARVVEPGQYPRLHLTGGQRAGCVDADRFRGRYVPHLIYDRDADNTESTIDLS
jgi:hypothetical protein